MPFGVDLTRAATHHRTDGNDATIVDCDIGAPTRHAGAVDHRSTPDHQVVGAHVVPLRIAHQQN
jgi:hypothetical protein